MDQCRINPLVLVESAMMEAHVHVVSRHNNVFYWVGPEWKWVAASDYIARIRDAETVLDRKVAWDELAPIGVQPNFRERITGYAFDFPRDYVLKICRANNRTMDISAADDRQTLIDGQVKFMDLEALCVNAGFKPVWVIRTLGRDDEFLPEAIVLPTEADGTMISAWWTQ